MKHILVLVMTLSLCTPSALVSAPRTIYRSKHTKPDREKQQSQQVVMVPVTVPQKPAMTAQEQQDRDILLAILSVAAHFGNVVFSENKPVAAQQAINSVLYAADVITRCRKLNISEQELSHMLTRALPTIYRKA